MMGKIFAILAQTGDKNIKAMFPEGTEGQM